MLFCEYIYNWQVVYVKYDNWLFCNVDGEYDGVYFMEGVLSNFVNIVSVEIMMWIGIDLVCQLGQVMGIEN